MSRNTLSRSLHDLGLSAWFGGTFANAVALNPAAAEAGSDRATGAVANAGWDRWTPVNAAAIATALTAAALGATAYSRALGKTVSEYGAVPAQSGTKPAATTPRAVANAQRQLSVLQWVVPAITGAVVVISSFAGEQERASEVHKGLLGRLAPS